MCVCVCVCVRACVRACVCVCVHVCVCLCKYVSECVSTHACMHACTHARTHACTHARMHACTHERMHACTHPIPFCVCTDCAYTCVTILNYAEVLVFFAEDWCNLRCADIHASQILQILFTTVKKTIVKARALYKHGAHSNIDTTATLSIRQRPSSSASYIARHQFLRWGSIPFSSRV